MVPVGFLQNSTEEEKTNFKSNISIWLESASGLSPYDTNNNIGSCFNFTTGNPVSNTYFKGVLFESFNADMLYFSVTAISESKYNYLNTHISNERGAIKKLIELNNQSITDETNTSVVEETITSENSTTIPLVNTNQSVDIPIPSGTKIEVATDTNGYPVNPLIKSYVDIIKSNKYTMKSVLMSNNSTSSVTVCISGNNLAFRYVITSDDVPSDLSIVSTGNNYYAIWFSNKTYQEMSKETYLKYIPSLDLNTNEKSKYLSTTTGLINGEKYICETYTVDGQLTKYFLFNDKLRRIENTADDGTAIFENIEIYPTVDESVFTIPNNFTYNGLFEDSLN